MTNCECCGTPVWVMYAPALCAPCERAGCDPTGPGSDKQTFDSDFGPVMVVKKANPCRRGT